MKVWIAGQPVESAEVDAFAAQENQVFDESQLLSLTNAESEADYLERLLTLQLSRCGVAPEDLPSGGLVGRVRSLLWKLLRPGFESLWFKQSNINAQLHYALRFEQQELKKMQCDLDQLKDRISRMEEHHGPAR